jgi:hypothetical protein
MTNKLKQVQMLQNDSGIQQLLDAASQILRNPIAMFDTNYSIIAHTEAITDDPIWNELVSTGSFSMETQRFFAMEYFTYEVSNANKMAILKSDELKYDRVSAYVFNRNHIKVALLVVVACTSPLDADDLLAFNALADKITKKIRGDEYYTQYGWSYHDAIINKILDGEITDTQIYAPHIQILYDGFERYKYLHLAVISSGQQDQELEDIISFLRERYRSSKIAIHSEYVVMVIGAKQNLVMDQRALAEYNSFLGQKGLSAGLSSNCENLYELRKYYDEAVAALSNCTTSPLDGSTVEQPHQHVFLSENTH